MSDTYLSPGVYIEETSYRSPSATFRSDGVTVFLGFASKGPVDDPVSIRSFKGFVSAFGPLAVAYPLTYAVRDYFANGGKNLTVIRIEDALGRPVSASTYLGEEGPQSGLFALQNVVNLGVLYLSPPSFAVDVPDEAIAAAIAYCELQRSFLILDSPVDWKSQREAVEGIQSLPYPKSDHAAMYFSRLALDKKGPVESDHNFPPGGAVAGIYAQTDLKRGIWKSPAGLTAKVVGYAGLSLNLSDSDNGSLNLLALNCLRRERNDLVVWGARTLAGADQTQSEYKYIAVRRLALSIESSLDETLKWVGLEPNGPALWAKVRHHVSDLLLDLFKKGALLGNTQKEAYFVRCDASTMTQKDIDEGILVVKLGFAPLKPAEFLVISIRVRSANANS